MYEQKVKRDKERGDVPDGRPPGQQHDEALDECMQSLKENNFRFTLEGGSIMAGRGVGELAPNADLAARYEKIKDARRRVKQDFRAQFAKEQHGEYIEEKKYEEVEENVDTNKGQYLPLQRIAHKEGGGREGLRAAISHVLRCLQMGDVWVRYDEWARRLKFLYFIRGMDENFKRAWSKHQTWRSTRKLGEAALPGPSGRQGIESFSLGFLERLFPWGSGHSLH
eukprot:8234407-Pyramimonas_sp.AAC.1